MEKQKILAISNKEEYICYTLEKTKSYYDFLCPLLKEFNIKIPDFYEADGEIVDILKVEDSHVSYNNGDVYITQITGHKAIFLIFHTNLRAKLRKFMEEHCEFIQSKSNL